MRVCKHSSRCYTQATTKQQQCRFRRGTTFGGHAAQPLAVMRDAAQPLRHNILLSLFSAALCYSVVDYRNNKIMCVLTFLLLWVLGVIQAGGSVRRETGRCRVASRKKKWDDNTRTT